MSRFAQFERLRDRPTDRPTNKTAYVRTPKWAVVDISDFNHTELNMRLLTNKPTDMTSYTMYNCSKTHFILFRKKANASRLV